MEISASGASNRDTTMILKQSYTSAIYYSLFFGLIFVTPLYYAATSFAFDIHTKLADSFEVDVFDYQTLNTFSTRPVEWKKRNGSAGKVGLLFG